MTMQDILFLLGLGLVSSFLGTLPLSTLNLSILKLALANRHQSALSFTYSASLVEFIQVCLTLFLMGILVSIPHLKTGFAFVSVPILIYLGYKSYKTPTRSNTLSEAELDGSTYASRHETQSIKWGTTIESDGFKQGLILSSVNVMVYPFWLLWGHVFVSNGWLKTDYGSLSLFCIGAGIGTFLAFLFFVVLGRLLWKRLYHLQFYINRLISLTFLGFAVLQLYTIFE